MPEPVVDPKPSRSANGQVPDKPVGEDKGLSVRQAGEALAGLLDNDGHYNPGGKQSRAHPDYIEGAGKETPERDPKGRFKKPAAETPKEVTEDDEDSAVDEPTEDTESGDTDEALDESADSSADDSGQETGELKTLADFAAALEIPLDELKESLTHSFTAAGGDVTVTLAELEKGYQRDADYRRSTTKLADDRRAFESIRQTTHDGYVRMNNIAATVLMQNEREIEAMMNSPELADLRHKDSSEWNARRTELGDRLNGIRNFRQQAAIAYDQFIANETANFKKREAEALMRAIPDFGDAHNAKAREAMKSAGYTDHEINSVLDHRLIVAAVQLADLRKQVAELSAEKEKAKQTVKRIQKDVPKLQQPTKSVQAKSKKGIEKDRVAKLRERAKRTGRVRDAAKVIEHLI